MNSAAKRLEGLRKVMVPSEPAKQEPAARDAAAPLTRAPSREGKMHISAWMSPQYKVSLRAIQMKRPQMHIQDLLAEALNDLFAKHNVPTVREE